MEIIDISSDSDMLHSPLSDAFTSQEIVCDVKSLNTVKSPGPDCQTSQLLKRADKTLFGHLTAMFIDHYLVI